MKKNYTNKKFKRHYVESHNTYKDIEYVICICDGGWRTAYINLKDTPLAHLDYDDIPLEIDVHGGFMWGAYRLPFESDCEEELFINNNPWYGWDYAHYGDGYDIPEAKKGISRKQSNIPYISKARIRLKRY